MLREPGGPSSFFGASPHQSSFFLGLGETFIRTKNGHEMGPYSSDFNDIWVGMCNFFYEESESGLQMAPKG